MHVLLADVPVEFVARSEHKATGHALLGHRWLLSQLRPHRPRATLHGGSTYRVDQLGACTQGVAYKPRPERPADLPRSGPPQRRDRGWGETTEGSRSTTARSGHVRGSTLFSVLCREIRVRSSLEAGARLKRLRERTGETDANASRPRTASKHGDSSATRTVLELTRWQVDDSWSARVEAEGLEPPEGLLAPAIFGTVSSTSRTTSGRGRVGNDSARALGRLGPVGVASRRLALPWSHPRDSNPRRLLGRQVLPPLGHDRMGWVSSVRMTWRPSRAAASAAAHAPSPPNDRDVCANYLHLVSLGRVPPPSPGWLGVAEERRSTRPSDTGFTPLHGQKRPTTVRRWAEDGSTLTRPTDNRRVIYVESALVHRDDAVVITFRSRRDFATLIAGAPRAASTVAIVWVPKTRPPHATWAYSWISPPSRSRRTTRTLAAAAGRGTPPSGAA
jgi:hypothetical protein